MSIFSVRERARPNSLCATPSSLVLPEVLDAHAAERNPRLLEELVQKLLDAVGRDAKVPARSGPRRKQLRPFAGPLSLCARASTSEPRRRCSQLPRHCTTAALPSLDKSTAAQPIWLWTSLLPSPKPLPTYPSRRPRELHRPSGSDQEARAKLRRAARHARSNNYSKRMHGHER